MLSCTFPASRIPASLLANIVSAAIEASMFISHGIWFLRTKSLRARAKEAGMTFDEYPEAIEWQNQGVDWTPETLMARFCRKSSSSE